VPDVTFDGEILKYRPNQTGTWRVGDDVHAMFRINAQGYNSRHSVYMRDRDPTRRRIAVIGDSYVAAFQVPWNRSFAEVLEDRLGADHTEVFRFGVDGSPLAQYVYVLEHEVLAYRPDVVIVVLVHNDFLESFRRVAGRYAKSFMVLDLAGDRIREPAPRPYDGGWADRIRRLAISRYFLYRQQLTASPLVQAIKQRLFGEPGAQRIEANVDMNEVQQAGRQITIATDYLFGRLADMSRSANFRLILVMDAPRTAADNDVGNSGSNALNELAARLARKHRLEFVDLRAVFDRHRRDGYTEFAFATDGHWNERAHRMVGETLAEYIATHPVEAEQPSAGLLESASVTHR
ncbi:MAG TPA: SGNH/GDSL hydrolase family protein, partial [Candidatus Binatia bacterium]|nr:SGNH/GDSL hydrolase family protein [Candidatus Binatia bacterium]